MEKRGVKKQDAKRRSKRIEALEDFELHHRILFFVTILVVTVLFIRIGVKIYNPNPVVAGFELHHFDYGLLLLFITTILLLFDDRKRFIYLAMAGISFGMILDDLGFILSNPIKMSNEILVYNSTLPATIIIICSSILIALLINYFVKRAKR